MVLCGKKLKRVKGIFLCACCSCKVTKTQTIKLIYKLKYSKYNMSISSKDTELCGWIDEQNQYKISHPATRVAKENGTDNSFQRLCGDSKGEFYTGFVVDYFTLKRP